MIKGVRVLSSFRRYRRGRLAAVAAAVLAAVLAIPATTAAASRASQGGASQGGASQGTSASCPWVSSRAPIAQRVAQLMSQMSLADEISMVEGHGTTNPYVFYTPCDSRAVHPGRGPGGRARGVADGLTGVTQLQAGVSLAAT